MKKKNPNLQSLFILTTSLLLSVVLFISCSEKNENVITNPVTDEATLNKDVNELTSDITTRFSRLTEYLQLTENQIALLKNFIEKQKKEIKENIRKNGRKWIKDKTKRLELRKKIREDFHAFLNSILTDEQKAKYEELITKIKNGEFFEERFNKWIEKITLELNLTNEQQAQIKALFEKKMKIIKSVKEGKYDKKEVFELIKKMRAEIKKELEKILTPEQMNKLEELMKIFFREIKHNSN